MLFCCSDSFFNLPVHPYLWNRPSYHSKKGHFFSLYGRRTSSRTHETCHYILFELLLTELQRAEHTWREHRYLCESLCEVAEVYNSPALLETVRRAELSHSRTQPHSGVISLTYRWIFCVLCSDWQVCWTQNPTAQPAWRVKPNPSISSCAKLLAAYLFWTLNLPPVPWCPRCGITIMTPAHVLLLIRPSWL